jgi:hypothetical protein
MEFREKDIVNVLKENGAVSGYELGNALGMNPDDTGIWMLLSAFVKDLDSVHSKLSFEENKRYLRVDKYDGTLGLNPSINEEFSIYTAVGLDPYLVAAKTQSMHSSNVFFSELRMNEGKGIAKRVLASVDDGTLKHPLKNYVSFMVAGDTVHDMSHGDLTMHYDRFDPTDKYTEGSNLDIVCITLDSLADEFLYKINQAFDTVNKENNELRYDAKNKMIIPKVDFTINRMGEFKKQMEAVSRMGGAPYTYLVAAIMANEGVHVTGEIDVKKDIKTWLDEMDIPKILGIYTDIAYEKRISQEQALRERFYVTA